MAGPTFLIIGSPKSGTTSLWSYLRSHPEIFMPEVKAPNFFIETMNWHKGVEWYESLFSAAGGAKARGEASPEYSMAQAYKGVPARIAGLYPGVKLIYIMRHPVERLRSHYLQNHVSGVEKRSIHQALSEHRGYLMTSRYAFQLEQYLAHFPREQMLLLTSESLRADRVSTLRRAFEFLGVDADYLPSTIETHRTQDKRMMSPAWGRLRATRVRDLVARVTPRPLRRALHGLSMRPVEPDDYRIPPELERELTDALRSDVAALRAYMHPDFDGWGLA